MSALTLRAGGVILAGLVAVLAASCGGPVHSTTPIPPSTPAFNPSRGPTPSPVPAAPSQPRVISCALALDPPTSSPAKAVPGIPPAVLPVDLVPTGAAVYALAFPQSWTWAPDALYSVGPAGGSCTGWVSAGGGSLGMQVLDARGDAVVDFVRAGGIGPAQSLACAYLAAARRGAEREFGTLDPSACMPSPGDRITQIATGIRDTSLAVVISTAAPVFLNSRMSGTTASLYAFQKGAEDDRGSSWRATCAPTLPRSTCAAALAFFAGGTPGIVFAGETPANRPCRSRQGGGAELAAHVGERQPWIDWSSSPTSSREPVEEHADVLGD